MSRHRLATGLAYSLAALTLVACQNTAYVSGEERAGGALTTSASGRDAYNQPGPTLTADEQALFQVGNNLNGGVWIVAPASVHSRDGLGPVYNATSCSGCHVRDGRGQPPSGDEEMVSALVRLSVMGVGAHGNVVPEPTYGD